MTACTEVRGADTPSHPFTSAWLVDGLIARGGVSLLTGERFAGRRRLMAHILTHMLAKPAGGPVLWTASDNRPVLFHHGFYRVLYCCGDEPADLVADRVRDLARAVGYEPTNWPLSFVDIHDVRLHSEDDRHWFAREVLATKQYDVVIVDPSRAGPAGQDFVLLRHLRRWSTKYDMSIMFMKPCLEGGKLPATVSARLTLERLSDAANTDACVLRREPSLPAMPDLRLVDLGDLLGFRVAA